jgi:molecular chaperone DnaK
MSVAIGIDLGTTNTVIAAVQNGRAVTLPDENGDKLLPSLVSFHPSGSVLVGAPAVERRLVDAENTIFSVKRLIGRNWSSQEVQQARTRFPFDLVEGAKESVLVRARGETYALPEISAFVLRRAKALAERALDDEVTHAVITVPANFNDLQRASTKVAGKLAGLEILRILNEPTAAALAYGQLMGKSERIAIYDLGGGTFDITVLDLSGAVFEVLATGGDSALGGDDIDSLIADRMADAFIRAHRFDARTNRESMGRLRIYAERLKCVLSHETIATVTLEGVAEGTGGRPLSLDFTMDREELEEVAGPLLGRTLEVARTTLMAAGLRESDIDKTILVGGATRMPLVPVLAGSFFQKLPSQRVNPDEVVALGAAMQAYALASAKNRDTATLSGRPSIPEPTMSGAATLIRNSNPRPPMVTMPDTTLSLPIPTQVRPAAGVPSGPSRGQQAPSAPPQRPPPPVPAAARSGGQPPPPPPAAGRPPVRRPSADIIPDADFTLDDDLPKPETPSEEMISYRRSAPELTFDIAPSNPPPPPVAAPPPQFASGPTHGSSSGLTLGSSSGSMPRANPSDPFQASVASRTLGEIMASPSVPAPFFQPAQRPPLLIDVTPLNLNVETVGGYCDILIQANSPIPCDRTRVFLTGSDNQTVANIRVAQGPERKFAENTYLGEVAITGLPAAPRGEVKIAVTFEIDADGILNVKAKDEVSGAHASAKLRLFGANTDRADVEAMARRQAQISVS